jgi:hypothetical protein
LFDAAQILEEKGNKKSGLNKCTKVYFRQLMIFVVRLHYSHYLMCELYDDKSKFDFDTFPQLPLVFDEIELALRSPPASALRPVDDTGSRVEAADSMSRLVDETSPSKVEADRMETNVTAARLTAVVNNVCTALQEFEVVVSGIMKSQSSDPNDA